MSEKNENDEALRNIEVTSEEITAQTSEEKPLTDTSNFKVSEIAFLPVLTDDTIQDTNNATSEVKDKESEPEQPTEYKEAVKNDEIIDEELASLISEINELDFLPLVTDVHEQGDSETLHLNSDKSNEDLEKAFESSIQANAEITSENVDFSSDVDAEELPAFELQEVSSNHTTDPEQDALTWIMGDNQLRNIDCVYETVAYTSHAEIVEERIPETIYYNEHEAYMMSLLDELEEMGDHREIPFLKELLDQETKDFIKNRLLAMIDKFSNQPRDKHKIKKISKAPIELPVFSVFADLFKNIDPEAKLILLDEVIHVGDEKEIEFLDGLLEDPNQELRDKANTVLQSLIKKLSQEKPKATYSRGVTAIVSEYKGVKRATEDQKYDSLLSEMEIGHSLSPEFLDVDFELSEILDKRYDNEILDITVIAIEVSPHDDSGSLMNSLRKLSKLF